MTIVLLLRRVKQLVLPVSYPAGIDMHEIWFCIIPHTTQLEVPGGIAQGLKFHSPETDIDRISQQMLAFFRYAGAPAAKQFIGFGGPVSGDYLPGFA